MKSTWGLLPVKLLLALLIAPPALAADPALTLAKRMANTSMTLWAVEGPAKDRFQYELGVFLRGIELVYEATGDSKYIDFIKFKVDRFVAPNGTINYNFTEYTLDNILTGRLVLTLYKHTNDPKYKTAADILRKQLKQQPRTNEGGFWHKLVYPYQMWLDGLYMAEPFYAEYVQLFDEPQSSFDDVANQFAIMEKRSRDSKTGLLYHGYDESRVQNWSDPTTGRSPSFWGRSVGWYFVALVDTIEYFPEDHPKRGELLSILNRLAVAVANVQDSESGLWWQVMDQANRDGNYLESSASAMFVYSYARGVRKGYLEEAYLKNAEKAWKGIVEEFVVELPNCGLNYTRICGVGGLGGTPYRNGTYEYYISEPIVTNDPKGVGAFMMAAVEVSRGNLS